MGKKFSGKSTGACDVSIGRGIRVSKLSHQICSRRRAFWQFLQRFFGSVAIGCALGIAAVLKYFHGKLACIHFSMQQSGCSVRGFCFVAQYCRSGDVLPFCRCSIPVRFGLTSARWVHQTSWWHRIRSISNSIPNSICNSISNSICNCISNSIFNSISNCFRAVIQSLVETCESDSCGILV